MLVINRLAFSKSFFYFLFGLGISLLFSSCTLHRLDVQTQYLSRESLASYHVETPDPFLYCPIIGQRLVIQWTLCAHEVEGHEVILDLKVRFRNHKEREVKVLITSKRGTYLYDLTNEDYCESGGILTYYAEIRDESCLLASWKHPLWVPLITLNIPENKEAERRGQGAEREEGANNSK
jgi:hypothetical protein